MSSRLSVLGRAVCAAVVSMFLVSTAAGDVSHPNLGSLDFSRGERDMVTVPDSPSLDLAMTATIEAWVYLDSSVKDKRYRIINKSDGQNVESDRSYELSLGTSPRTGKGENISVDFFTGTGDGWVSYDYPYSFSVDTWFHVAATYDAIVGRSDLYLNGQWATGVAGTANHNQIVAPIKNSAQPLQIGTNTRAFSHDGYIDEVRIWCTARDASEIAATWNKRISDSATNLVGYWTFDEQNGQVAYDMSPAGNDGLLGTRLEAEMTDPMWVATGSPLVPEPAAMSLLALGGLAMLRRRRKVSHH